MSSNVRSDLSKTITIRAIKAYLSDSWITIISRISNLKRYSATKQARQSLPSNGRYAGGC